MATVAKSTKIYSAFHPGMIGPLHAWYDAADSSTLSLTGTSVRYWYDKSGNNYTLSAGGFGTFTSPTYDTVTPTLSSAIPSTVRFSLAGFAQGMMVSSLSLPPNEGVSVAIVLKYGQTNNASSCAFAINASSAATTSLNTLYYTTGVSADPFFTSAWWWFFGSTAPAWRGRGVNLSGNSGTTNAINTEWGVHMMTWLPSNTFVQAGIMSGAAGGAGANVVNTLTLSNGAFYMGGEPSFLALSGNIAEFLMYRGTFTEIQKSAVAWYLTRKWNLTTTTTAQVPYTASIAPLIRPFHPYDISGLLRWYDADDDSTIALSALSPIRILSWFDKSKNNTNVSDIESYFPFASSNTIRFNGTGNLGNSRSTITISGPGTWNETAVVNQGSGTYYQTIAMYAYTQMGGFGGGVFGIQRNLNAAGTSASGGSLTLRFTSISGVAANVITGSAGISLNVLPPRARLAIATSAYNQHVNLYESGLTLSQSTAAAATSTPPASRLTLSQASPGGQFIFTEIGEILVYQSMLGYVERSKLEGYLAWKWGTTGNLPNSHPYKTSIPYEIVYPVTPASEVALWFDAADTSTLVLSGNQVLRWSNKGQPLAFGPTFLSYGGGTVQTRSVSLNGLNVITFGSNGYLSGTGGNSAYSTTARSYAFVARVQDSLSTTASAARIINRLNISSDLLFLSKNSVSTTGLFLIVSGFGGPMTTGTLPTSNLEVSSAGFFIATMLGTAATGNLRVRFNGSNCLGGGGAGGSFPALGSVLGPLVIGGVNVTGQRSVSFDLCELIQFNSLRPLEDAVRLEGYLAWKWGLRSSLSTTHPFRQYPP